MKSIPIHLPLNSNGQTIRVFVTPNKYYGNYKGIELIQMYSKKRKVICQNPEVTKHYIFIPNGQLSKTIKVNGGTYPTRAFFNKIEQLYGKQILYKRELRAIKCYRNISLLVPEVLKC